MAKKSIKKRSLYPESVKFFRTKDYDNRIFCYDKKPFGSTEYKEIIEIGDLPSGYSIKIITTVNGMVYYDFIKGSIQKRCSVNNCWGKHFSKGYCNGHYYRFINNKSLDTPLRKIPNNCDIEGCENKSTSKGLCRNHLRREVRRQRSEFLIEKMGGRCYICRNIYHYSAYDFHHIDPAKKDFALSQKMETPDFDKILQEAKKCLLVCSNCHRELHFNLNK